MVVKHCAYGVCTSDSRYLKDSSKVFFLRFPNPKTETERCKRWIAACRRPKFTLSKITRYSYICSLHFVGENGPTEVNPDPISATFSMLPTARERPVSVHSISQIDVDDGIIIQNDFNNDIAEDSMQDRGEIAGLSVGGIEQQNEILCKSTTSTTENITTPSTSPKPRNILDEPSIRRQKTHGALINKYRVSNYRLRRKLKIMEGKLNCQSFNLEVVRQNSRQMKFYTGLSVEQFDVLWTFLGEEALNLDHWRSGNQKSRPKKKESLLTPQNQLFLTLCRLRVGLLIEDLAYRFSVSMSYASRIINTWIMFMYVKFKALDIFPPRETDKAKLPKVFRKFKNIRVIIDGFEVRTQKAEDYREQGNTYSAYKGQATFKFLCGMHPSGGVCFLSDAYEGAISDRDIFVSCGITNYLQNGDLIMADRGFNVADICNSLHCQLLTPPFLAGRNSLTREEIRTTRDIASTRVHVERVIGRIKEYRILQRVLPKTLVPVVSQMAFVIAMLVNFQEPLVKM